MALQKPLALIYALPLEHLPLYCVFTALIFCALYRRFAEWRRLRPCLWLMLFVWFALVLWVTLLSRDVGNAYDAHWIPLHSYLEILTGGNPETFRSNLMNMVLFYPAGLLFSSLMSQKRSFRSGMIRTVLLFGLFSLAIELSQFWLQCGFCEIDDVLHNTLGAGMGFAAFCAFEKNTDI